MTIKTIQRADYTFRYNQNMGRHGWLRLTPAYSVKLVHEIMKHTVQDSLILDPFAGTATTGLVSCERGLSAHCFDINPFLLWFAQVKCQNYETEDVIKLSNRLHDVLRDLEQYEMFDELWVPDIHNITRWWNEHTLKILAVLQDVLAREFGEPQEKSTYSLVWVAFCRLIIETSSAAFDHVSMSFQEATYAYGVEQIKTLYTTIFSFMIESVKTPLEGTCRFFHIDSKNMISLEKVDATYSHVITSPPYPNRISYIRELRPYMYWTKFLQQARDAFAHN